MKKIFTIVANAIWLSAMIVGMIQSLEQTRINSQMAKDIHDKYVDPPFTTDFAIMFLPFENIYAEVIRRTSLVETLQKEFKIVVTGPTTLGAILNSLQMGFRTLAIQKRTSEVWNVLGAVKTEFGKFGGLLEKVQKNLPPPAGRWPVAVHPHQPASSTGHRPSAQRRRWESPDLALAQSPRGRAGHSGQAAAAGQPGRSCC